MVNRSKHECLTFPETDQDDIVPWENLARAIVTQAVDEYKQHCNTLRRQLVRLKEAKDPEEYKNTKAKVQYFRGLVRGLERWIRSDWCYELSGLEADVIIGEVRKRCGITKEEIYSND